MGFLELHVAQVGDSFFVGGPGVVGRRPAAPHGGLVSGVAAIGCDAPGENRGAGTREVSRKLRDDAIVATTSELRAAVGPGGGERDGKVDRTGVSGFVDGVHGPAEVAVCRVAARRFAPLRGVEGDGGHGEPDGGDGDCSAEFFGCAVSRGDEFLCGRCEREEGEEQENWLHSRSQYIGKVR